MRLAHPRPSFGEKLKVWRRSLGLSQLQLAVDSDVSPRHLSFIETGRSQPSRDMVLRLAHRLRLPLREQNALLLAAGFAPAFAQSNLEAPDLSAVHNAATLVLQNHEPFPAVALDRRRNVVISNRAAQRLLRDVPLSKLGSPLNIYRLLLHPDGLAPRIVDFAEYSQHLLLRLLREAELSSDPESFALLEELSTYPHVQPPRDNPPETARSMLTLRLREGTAVLAFVATLATFGSPFDISTSEIVVESLFPADAQTAEHMRARALAHDVKESRPDYLGGK